MNDIYARHFSQPFPARTTIACRGAAAWEPALRSISSSKREARHEGIDPMKYTFHIVDVFSSALFGGNQLAVLPDAAGISTEGMQKIAREFNFSETDLRPAEERSCEHVSSAHLHASDGARFCGASHGRHGLRAGNETARCGLDDPIRLILEENIGPVTVDVTQQNGEFHGKLTLSGRIDSPPSAPSQTDLAAVLSIEPAEVSQVFFAGVGVPFCFAQLKLERCC